MRELNVWGGMLMTEYGQKRCIVATRTKKRAAELLEVSRSYLNEYCSQTGNDIELRVAKAQPETVFIRMNEYPHIWEVYRAKADAKEE